MRKTKGLYAVFVFLLLPAMLAACSPVSSITGDSGTEIQDTELLSGKEAQAETGIEISEEELPEHLSWYYTQLSEEDRRIYLQMYVILRDHLEYTQVDSTDTERVSGILEYVLLDNPELYYVENLSLQYTMTDGEILSLEIAASENMSAEEQKEADARIAEFLEGALSGITEEMTDYDKAVWLYDYVIDRIVYRADAPYNQNLYSVALGESVCKGYACGYQYLCNALGIPCISVHGALNGQEHAWNMVCLDGKWCHVDCTSGEDLVDSLGITDYVWFGITDEQISETHAYRNPELLPAADSMENNYFFRNGCYFEQADAGRLAELMEQGEDFVIQCSTQEVYEEMYELLLEDESIQQVLRNYGDEGVKYGRLEASLTIYLFF